ncbi:MAG: baseplate J/gp47 family protein [Eubacteriales bacterium]|jgi:phage-related baseplate assembly protein
MASSEDILKMLESLPGVSFIGQDTLTSIQEQMVDDYQTRYQELTGKTQALSRADPVTLVLYACSVQIYQMALYTDMSAKQSLLKYAFGEYLDNLAALKGITRKHASRAIVTVRFSLSEPRKSAVGIPEGTRVSAGGDVFFATTEYNEIPAGQDHIDLICQCLEEGDIGNDILAGTINTLVDPIAYMDHVESLDASFGGADEESDDDLRYRIFEAPFRWSVAGPEEAYRYWAGEYSTEISDVYVGSPGPGEVLIEFLMLDGELPESAMVSGMEAYLSSEEIRPLTDKVVVKAPDTEAFKINLTYYINRSQSSGAATIQAKVADAVELYRQWQTAHIGRDINPSELIRQVIDAGAKRVEVTSPSFKAIPMTSVARCAKTDVTITYGGLEDD